MNLHTFESDTESWANTHFGNVQLFDRRRVKRLKEIAARLAQNKGQSLARLYDRWYDIKAVYNLINLDIMTPDVIQKCHRENTKENIMNWENDVLLIEDSSEFEWNNLAPIEGLGPIGSGRKNDQGFILHSTLAVGIVNADTFTAKILGLPYQQFYIRPATRSKRHKRCNGNINLETDLWRNAINSKSFPKADSNRLIRVCDRAADIYEVIVETKDAGYNSIIRAKHDRRDNKDDEIKLFAMMRELPSIGMTAIERRGRTGTKKRTIPMNINWQEVQLKAPARPGYRAGELPPLELTVIHVWGYDSETDEVIEWFFIY